MGNKNNKEKVQNFSKTQPQQVRPQGQGQGQGQGQQQQQQQEKTTTTTSASSSSSSSTSYVSYSQENLLKVLPDLPESIALSQGVAFSKNKNNKELLICSGFNNNILSNNCYSFHLLKQQYQIICSYPAGTDLAGHVVVSYFSNFDDNDDNNDNDSDDNFTLLSFGGYEEDNVLYHTLKMNYKSIWKDDINLKKEKEEKEEEEEEEENEKKKNKKDKNIVWNQWVPLPNNILFGKNQQHDLRGARALVGGSQRHLLFLTHRPNNINVIDLQSFQYLNDVKNNTIPVLEDMEICHHCFVMTDAKGGNIFILMSKGETLLIQYNEAGQEFSYQKILYHSPFSNLISYAFACSDHDILIFGGYNNREYTWTNNIWKFSIKEKIWKKCHIQLPYAVNSATAIMGERNSAIHIIGGRDESGLYYKTHLVLNIWTENQIETIMKYWIRTNEWRTGWIREFSALVANYLNP